ncbi:MAG: hypothetical protein PQJ61_03270 [Spirochaetales bacterium]|uniref:Flavodoxin domain-containing protein n=1 Tax=Candidatus Thalassospirochaeta sargassi TaxID=3119039 RepID=A0AAJ1MMV9_9SPIO|nr:hypothetical protein [Spirochaetales bacterium]
MNMVVVYYSGKGSNKFLAGKAADALDCEAVELKPRAPGLVMPATATKISFGNKPVTQDIAGFDRVVLCGPLYMGSIAAPCSDFIRKYGKAAKRIDFITCCGSTDEKKDDTFGYGRVFAKLKECLGSKAGEFEAFPIQLLLPEDKKNNDNEMMNTRMNDDNFNEAVQQRLYSFQSKLSR